MVVKKLLRTPTLTDSMTIKSSMGKCTCKDVLVVDDDGFNLITFQEVLRIYGIESEGVCNGQEAV